MNRPIQKKLSVHQHLGPIHEDYIEEDDENLQEEQAQNPQWCPTGIFTKNQKRRVQRMRNKEQMQEVEE